MSNTNSGNYNSGNYNSGNYNSGNYNSGNYNSGDFNSGSCNSGNYNSGDFNSGSCNSGYRNSGDFNSGSCNSGSCNSGSCNSGNYNSGDFNSGLFNTDEPFMRCFNKETNVKRSEFEGWPSFYDFRLNYWIDESNMTTSEKEENPEYKTTGGFLKTVDYKTAWRVFWDNTDEENRQKFLDLPNFDAAIFEEITGIDVKRESEDIIIDGKKFSVDTVKEALKNHTSF